MENEKIITELATLKVLMETVLANISNVDKKLGTMDTHIQGHDTTIALMQKDIQDAQKDIKTAQDDIAKLQSDHTFNWVHFTNSWMGKIMILGISIGIIALIVLVISQFNAFNEVITRMKATPDKEAFYEFAYKFFGKYVYAFICCSKHLGL